MANKLGIFDTETTGLTLHPNAPLHKQPQIIEFGFALMEEGEVTETANILINPGCELDPVITKITGITDADLVGAPSFEGVLPQIRRLFAKADVAVAHNLPFDKALLHFELARLEVMDFPWPTGQMCTVALYRDIWGYNPKLLQLYEHVMGEPLNQTHRALDDVMAIVDIVKKEKLWSI